MVQQLESGGSSPEKALDYTYHEGECPPRHGAMKSMVDGSSSDNGRADARKRGNNDAKELPQDQESRLLKRLALARILCSLFSVLCPLCSVLYFGVVCGLDRVNSLSPIEPLFSLCGGFALVEASLDKPKLHRSIDFKRYGTALFQACSR